MSFNLSEEMEVFQTIKSQILEVIDRESAKEGAMNLSGQIRGGDWCNMKDMLNERFREYLDAHAKYQNMTDIILKALEENKNE